MQASDALIEAYLRESLSAVKNIPVSSCLSEVTEGVGANWQSLPVLGATRSGRAPAKEPVGKNPERYKPVQSGTVFYNPMRILLGSIAMIDEDDEPGITSPDYVAMRCIGGILHPRWFYYWFRSTHGVEFIKSLSRGAVRERLLFKRLAKEPIPVPAWEAQQTFAERAAGVRNLKALLREQINHCDRIPAILLREAFSGQS